MSEAMLSDILKEFRFDVYTVVLVHVFSRSFLFGVSVAGFSLSENLTSSDS
jgi:hypothetical protein